MRKPSGAGAIRPLLLSALPFSRTERVWLFRLPARGARPNIISHALQRVDRFSKFHQSRSDDSISSQSRTLVSCAVGRQLNLPVLELDQNSPCSQPPTSLTHHLQLFWKLLCPAAPQAGAVFVAPGAARPRCSFGCRLSGWPMQAEVACMGVPDHPTCRLALSQPARGPHDTRRPSSHRSPGLMSWARFTASSGRRRISLALFISAISGDCWRSKLETRN